MAALLAEQAVGGEAAPRALAAGFLPTLERAVETGCAPSRRASPPRPCSPDPTGSAGVRPLFGRSPRPAAPLLRWRRW